MTSKPPHVIAEEIECAVTGHHQLVRKDIAYRLSREGYIKWNRSPLFRGWELTAKGSEFLKEYGNAHRKADRARSVRQE